MQKENKNKETSLDDSIEEMLYGNENTNLNEKIKAHVIRKKFRGINKAK